MYGANKIGLAALCSPPPDFRSEALRYHRRPHERTSMRYFMVIFTLLFLVGLSPAQELTQAEYFRLEDLHHQAVMVGLTDLKKEIADLQGTKAPAVATVVAPPAASPPSPAPPPKATPAADAATGLWILACFFCFFAGFGFRGFWQRVGLAEQPLASPKPATPPAPTPATLI